MYERLLSRVQSELQDVLDRLLLEKKYSSTPSTTNTSTENSNAGGEPASETHLGCRIGKSYPASGGSSIPQGTFLLVTTEGEKREYLQISGPLVASLTNLATTLATYLETLTGAESSNTREGHATSRPLYGEEW